MAWLPAYALLIVMAVGDDIVFQSLSLNFIPDEAQTGAAPFTAADLQGPRRRMAWRSLQRSGPRTVNTPKRSVLKPSAGLRWGGRCGPVLWRA